MGKRTVNGRRSGARDGLRAAALALVLAAGGTQAGTDVLTYKNDLGRTGQNQTETTLTPANVTASSFGLLRVLAADGKVDAQPLYVSDLTVAGAARDVAIIASEHDSVYAYDVDTGASLWHVSLLPTGESTSDARHCGQVKPEIGITSTPVIDRNAGRHGTVYVVAMSKERGAYHQRLHALDLTTGAELLNGPTEIAATFPTAGGTTVFSPGRYEERAALLLSQGVLYTSWTSHCDIAPYTGWIIAYDAATLTRGAVLNVAPNSRAGPAIWMSGGGPAADAEGNVFLLTGNGAFETQLDANGFPSGHDYGNSFLKMTTTGHGLAVADYFTVSDEIAASKADRDLGSGGVLLLPNLADASGTERHLMVGAGKDGNLYVVDRDSLGKFDPGANHIWQELRGVLPGGIWSTPAYYNGTVYYGDVGSPLKAFPITQAKLANAAQSQSASSFAYPGTAPSVSANGNHDGIVWALENSNPAVLHAYDATNLAHELYDSAAAPESRDRLGPGNKFVTPTIADGKVFVATTTGVAVFGLLH